MYQNIKGFHMFRLIPPGRDMSRQAIACAVRAGNLCACVEF